MTWNSTFKPSAKPMKPKKLRKCCMCKTSEVANVFAKLCTNIDCVIAYGNREREKRIKKENAKIARAEREDRTRRKEALKSRSDWLKDVQYWFNRMRRLQDLKAGHLCISCQNPNPNVKINAGHYLSVGSHPELRFEPLNVHLQCEHCNTYKSGNQAAYRPRLIERIGLDKVEWLEGPHKPKKYTVDDCKRMIAEYKVICKEIT